MRKFSFRFFKKLPEKEKRLTISNFLTISRIALTPFIVASMIRGSWGAAFWLFVIASALDVLDGNLARWLDQKTFLGSCLDPLADKILLISCFATLAFVQSPSFSIPLWFVLLMLFKEIIIFVGAAVLYMIKGHLEVAPTIIGKGSTVVQVWFIIWLFACYFFGWMPIKTYYAALTVVVVFVLLSFIQYLRLGIVQWRK